MSATARSRSRSNNTRVKRAAPRAVASPRQPAGGKGEWQYVVGIGASAGGLEALRALFGAIKTRPRMAFVVVQHLAPLHRSRLVELIAHATALPVEEVHDGAAAQPGTIYITPPNKDVLLERGLLRLREPRMQPGPKPSIDLFFESLAEDVGECAIGIVLSGTGSDGAAGIRAIKAAGGVTICQAIESAKYDGMPKAARHTGAVDLELAPEDIAREIDRFDRLTLQRRDWNKVKERATPADPYHRILMRVEKEVGASFSHYKQNTVRRRMERRMIATRNESLDDYAQYLEEHPGEARLLFQDILISVTSFFRDGDAFKALNRKLVERLKAKDAGAPLRCWIVGCATGEEAYSVGMLLLEALDKLKKQMPVQIYATDLDDHALAAARKAHYPKASLSALSKELCEKYFVAREDSYQVKPALRDMIVFARHNVAADPPFLNMDLVSCRNVLIYFNNRLQEQVFKTLHYALQPGGLLFLGRSEAVPAASDSFEVADKHARIYTRVGRRSDVPRAYSRTEPARERATPRTGEHETATDAFQALVLGIAPDSILIDDALHIRHVYGNAGSYLAYPRGEATQNVTKLVSPDMGLELNTLVHRAQRVNAAVQGRRHEFQGRGQVTYVQQKVVPLGIGSRRHYLVSFASTVEKTRTAKQALSGPPSELRLRKLEQELAATREHLQTVVEEQENSNEELQALNEELQSANEELQSSNEELETTNEELQSANEELTTVNEELNVKSGELQTLNQRLVAIQSAIVYPLLIVDRHGRLVNFNPAARHLLRVTDADIGTPLAGLRPYIDLKEVIRAVHDALTSETEPCLQFSARERSFEVQVHLFRGAKDAVEGAVVSFVENSEIVTALDESRLNRERLSSILESTPAIVTMKDLSGVYIYANRRFCEVTGRGAHAVIGCTDEEVFGAEAAAQVQERDYEVIKKKRSMEFTEPFVFNGKQCIWRSSKFPLFDAKKRVHSVCSVSLDMTQRLGHEQQLELFKRAVSASNNGIVLLAETDGEFKVTYASDRVPATIGIDERHLPGLALAELLERTNLKMRPAQLEALVSQIRDEPEGHFTLNMDRNGKDAWVDVRSAHADFKDAARRKLILNFFDVSERVEDQRTISTQQEELTKFSRFSALAQIASGIAHEINTPLNVITTKTDYIRMLAKRGKLDSSNALKLATDIEQMVRNVSSIVYGLRSVALRDPAKFEIARFKRIVLDTVKICEFRLQRYGIDMRLDLPQKDLLIKCYPVQITQIIINLLNNSVDAIQDRTDRWIAISLKKKGDMAHLTITDSGDGIDATIAEKVMTPFFTTKKDQKGTGIGLSLSRSIARRHGGDLVLDIDSRNTSFRLELPL